ncbi:hypothetical protein SAPIO_CDS4741 [Scedosporium apiospermum]|uniref:Clr5 domain-containing protein n=1 Tax=Pseudallescheria apiosperma TaxID=563466 RepID=A0A084G7I5_PSEDA|nr:uncharacterized protein SAPIO_CDS4741 [Scedosporium apiospermum]KEZ43297.1 hypothetical protein SAPIO_CDS4741 [Scedosporium apiospermum]
MEREHKFFASSKLYKDRLRSWGFSKNLKQAHVRDIVQQTKLRHGRDTEVIVAGQKVALDRVQRSYDRLPAVEAKAPVADIKSSHCNDEVVVSGIPAT